jgi:ribonuclease P protein component
MPEEQHGVKIGVAAGKAVGSAVKRNRAKRRLRAVLDEFVPNLQPGYNLIVIAREAINRASYFELRAALRDVLIRAQLLKESNEFPGDSNAGVST